VNIGLTTLDILFNNKNTLDFFFLIGLVEAAFFSIIGSIITFTEPYEQKSLNSDKKKTTKRNTSFEKRKPLTKSETAYYGKILILTGILLFIVVGFIDIFV
jgi:hypothetical protein